MDQFNAHESRPKKIVFTSALLSIATLGWLTFAAGGAQSAGASGRADRPAVTSDPYPVAYPALDRLIARLAAEARAAGTGKHAR